MVTVNDWVSGDLLILFEDGGSADDTFEIDGAAIHIANAEKSPVYWNIGRIYLPFGSYASAFISDPLTLDVGETRSTALEVGWQREALDVSAYLFKNRVGNTGDSLNGFGAKLGFNQAFADKSFRAGLHYTNSLADAGTLQAALTDTGTDLATLDKTAGIGAYLHANIGEITILGEYIAAQDAISGDNTRTKVSAYHTEVNYSFQWLEQPAVVGVSYHKTKQAASFDLPKQRAAAVFGVDVMENVVFTIEAGNEKDYAGESSHYTTAQLAIAF